MENPIKQKINIQLDLSYIKNNKEDFRHKVRKIEGKDGQDDKYVLDLVLVPTEMEQVYANDDLTKYKPGFIAVDTKKDEDSVYLGWTQPSVTVWNDSDDSNPAGGTADFELSDDDF